MWAHPGKKLLFMGGEFGQRREWTHDGELEWHVAASRRATRACSAGWRDLNRVYRATPALHELDFSADGFEWVDSRRLRSAACSPSCASRATARRVLVVCNFTPVPRTTTASACRSGGLWRELPEQRRQRLTAAAGRGNLGGVEAAPVPCARPHALAVPHAAAAVHRVPEHVPMPECQPRRTPEADARRRRTAARAPSSRPSLPQVDGGRFAVKRVVGETVRVAGRRASPTATTCCACVLRWRSRRRCATGPSCR